jgi:hypothetical protein
MKWEDGENYTLSSSLLNIIKGVKSGRMGWNTHVASMEIQ